MSRKFELSHDVLARTVYEKSSQEDRMLLHLESFVKERHAYYQESGVYLIDKDLARLLPYLDKLSISAAEHAFITTSQRRARKNRNRRLVMLFATVFLPVTIGLAVFAFYEANQADKQRSEALDAKAEAEIARSAAEDQKQLALKEKKRALTAREEAEIARQLADEKSAQLDQKNRELRAKTSSLDSALKVNTRLNAEISTTNKLLANRLDRTQNTLINTTQTLQQSIDNTDARLRGFQAEELYRLGNTIDGFNLAAYAYGLSANVKAQQVLFSALRDYQDYGKAMFMPLDEKDKLLVQQQVVMSGQVLNLKSISEDKRANATATQFPQRPNTAAYHRFGAQMLGVAYHAAHNTVLVLLPDALVQVDPEDLRRQQRYPFTTATATHLSASPHQPEGAVFLSDGSALYYRIDASGRLTLRPRDMDWEEVESITWGMKPGDDCLVLLKNGSRYVWTKAGTRVPMPRPSLAAAAYNDNYCWQLLPNGQLLQYRHERPTYQRLSLGVPSQYWPATTLSTNRNGDHLLIRVKNHSLRLLKKSGERWALQDTIRFNYDNYRDNIIQMDFIPGLNGIAAITDENKLFLYSMSVRKPLRQILLPQQDTAIYNMRFSGDALRFLVNSKEYVFLCDVSGAVLQTYRRDSEVEKLATQGEPAGFFVSKDEAILFTHYNNALERKSPVSGKGVTNFFYERGIVPPFTPWERQVYDIPDPQPQRR